MNEFVAVISARISTPPGDGESHTEQFEKIVRFLHDHPHNFVAERARASVEEAFDSGNILLVEVPDNGDFAIEGSAFVYEFLDSTYIEIGTVNIPGLGGFDMQKLLIILTACRFLLVERENHPVVFATFNGENEKQYEKLADAYMRPWPDPPDELVEAKSHTIVSGAEKPVYFVFDENKIDEACRYLISIVDGGLIPERKNRYTGIKEQLKISEIRHFTVRRLMELVRRTAVG